MSALTSNQPWLSTCLCQQHRVGAHTRVSASAWAGGSGWPHETCVGIWLLSRSDEGNIFWIELGAVYGMALAPQMHAFTHRLAVSSGRLAWVCLGVTCRAAVLRGDERRNPGFRGLRSVGVGNPTGSREVECVVRSVVPRPGSRDLDMSLGAAPFRLVSAETR